MPLTATTIRSAKPGAKDYKLTDEKGLYLLVTKAGGRLWRLKYRLLGKEKLMALGAYPEVSLAKAREKRDDARKLLADGVDPMEYRKTVDAAQRDAATNSFEAVALEWLSKRGKKSESGDKRLKRALEKDLFPYIGKRPINEITAPELLSALRRIEDRGAVETAHRTKQFAGQIFRYAIASGRADRDPSADLKGALKTPKETHFSALTKPKDVARLMQAIHSYQGTPVVTAALKLAPLLFCRPGELRHLEWSDVNWDKSRLELPAERMKTGQEHIIPLSRQAREILEGLYPVTGNRKYIFPSARGPSRPLSENTIRVALRTLGYTNDQMTAHGFRAMARTLLDEELEYPSEWIEHQLAHAVRDPNGRAYNRTKYLRQREEMMQRWADYLDELRAHHTG